MRKFFILLGSLIAAFLIAVIGMGLFLMLAPGAEIFGIKYIKNVASTSAEVTKQYDDPVTGDLVFDTMGVPVTIEYRTDTSFVFEFVQKFNGFTRSKIDQASLSVAMNPENGNLEVKTNEFKKFLWGSNRSGYYLNVKIPATYVGHNIALASESSKVVVKTNGNALGEMADLSIITKGEVSFSGNFSMQKLSVTGTQKALTIPSGFDIAGDVIVESGKKAVKVETPVGGLLKVTTKGGGLSFISAKSLEANTAGGSVKSTSTEVCVEENASISSGNGRVTLQYVGGDLSVKTKGGNVEIGQNDDSVLKGVSGKVNIETKNGSIYLKGTYSETETVFLQTSSGKIIVGDNNRTAIAKQQNPYVSIGNLEVVSSKGAISIESAKSIKVTAKKSNVAIGNFVTKAEITTTSGDVEIYGDNAFLGGELVVNTGKNGNIVAKNLSGKTTISTKGTADISFMSVNDKIDISGDKKWITVTLPKTISELTNYFWVESGTNATIKVNGLEKEQKSYHTVDEIPAGKESKVVRVVSSKGKITIQTEQ